MKITRKTCYKEVHERELEIDDILVRAINNYVMNNASSCLSWIPLNASVIYSLYKGKVLGKPLHARASEQIVVDIAKNGKTQSITLAQFVYWFIDEAFKSGLYSTNRTNREFVDTVDELDDEPVEG